MLLIALLRLLERTDAATVAASLALAVVAGGAALSARRPLLMALGNLNLLIFFVGVVGGHACSRGVPIAFSFGARDLRLSGARPRARR